ncbi:MAG: NAD(+) synthase [Desulfobacterales bacterium]|nr:NAD(+) synthase [Desulfobacterales bacterium]
MAYEITREQANEAIKRIRGGIQTYFKENNLTYAIFGKSEGLDSSVIAGLLSDLPGVKPIGVLMPCESDPDVEKIARHTLDHFKIPNIRVDLTPEFHAVMTRFYSAGAVQDQLIRIVRDYGDHDLVRAMALKKSRAAGNIKVRLRMITLYHIAQLTGGLVISTDNLSELWMGFWTLNGDVGDFSPIQHVWKGLEEYTIAEALGVPESSLNAVPTDGLDVVPAGVDEDQLGLPYPELDRVIIRLLQNKLDAPGALPKSDEDALIQKIAKETGHPAQTVQHTAHKLTGTHFKRHWPIEITREDTGLPDIKSIDVLS